MSVSRKEEQRVLSKSELELVEQSHHPVVQQLERKELAELAKALRTARDKARDQARQQRRELRGKSAPRGATSAKNNDSQIYKKRIFANALQRVNKYLARHKHIEAAHRALELKKQRRATLSSLPGGKSRTAGKGMKAVTNPKDTVEKRGSETGRQRDYSARSQARRDSKG